MSCLVNKRRANWYFMWALPKQTFFHEGLIPRLVSLMRLRPREDEEPWLIPQLAPSCSDPFGASSCFDNTSARRAMATLWMSRSVGSLGPTKAGPL